MCENDGALKIAGARLGFWLVFVISRQNPLLTSLEHPGTL